MLKVYGSHFCPYCKECIAKYNAGGISYEFHDISDGLMDLKEFLKLRDDNEEEFAEAKANNKLGIPVLVTESGDVTHDWRSYVSDTTNGPGANADDSDHADSNAVQGAACKLDGSGC